MHDSQNSTGFLTTQLISTESLIDGVPNFDFEVTGEDAFTEDDIEIPENLMLGKRAERFFSEWVNRSSSYELIAENIQVIENKQTLGEFDFMVRRIEDGQLIHIELIYKFYLFDPTVQGSEFEKWIGPNQGDRLDFKRDKLANHQFPLMYTQAAKDRLLELGIDSTNIEQQVLFLANLFVPFNGEVDFIEVNKEAVQGVWMRLEDWKKRSTSSDQFAIPEKKDWFSRELKNARWLSREDALLEIESLHGKKKSPLVWKRNEDGNQFKEFVVWW